MQQIFIGTSGYNYKSWKDVFYPKGLAQKDWLSFYSSHFKTLEINATFYRHFEKKVYEKWCSSVADDFLFVIKGSRSITHLKKLKGIEDELARQLEAVGGLGEKLGALLWQFPASFKASEENKEKISQFLRVLPTKHQYAFEFRDRSWFEQGIGDLFNAQSTAIVINDTLAFDVTHELLGNFAYVRFHGPTALYSSSYSDESLKEWAEKIKEWSKTGTVLCYFNNDMSGYAIANATTLTEFLS
jgi:uncharacterized protein YecE (DUF72 family)